MKHFKFILTTFILLTTIFFANSQTNVNQSLSKEDPNAAEITFDKLVHDYGTIKMDTNGAIEFVFKNTGKSDLILTNVSTSCGCTVPTWPREPILPGKTSTIKVVYDTGRIGAFSKTITVISNAKTNPVVLTIKGTVIQ